MILLSYLMIENLILYWSRDLPQLCRAFSGIDIYKETRDLLLPLIESDTKDPGAVQTVRASLHSLLLPPFHFSYSNYISLVVRFSFAEQQA